MLENLQYIYAVVNCVECYMPQLLFEPILNKIHGNYHYLCNCSIIYSFTNYNLFTSIYSTFTDSEAALLYHISEIKSCLSWGRRKKSHVLRWLSLLPFCLLLYFSPLLRACFTQSGIYVINTIYFPVNIGTRWLEKGMGSIMSVVDSWDFFLWFQENWTCIKCREMDGWNICIGVFSRIWKKWHGHSSLWA